MDEPNYTGLVLSVRQPWAWMIMSAGKDVENRTWATKVRGRVLIHAAKGMTKAEWASAWWFVRDRIPSAFDKGIAADVAIKSIERGGIIGSVEIVDCVTRSNSPWFQGPYGFVLANPRPLPFLPLRGQLGFFRI